MTTICFFLKRSGELPEAYDAILAKGSVPLIIDCGANTGLSAIMFAKKFPYSRVLAIEPGPDNCVFFKRNCRGLHNIKLYQNAIGSELGTVSLSGSRNDALRTTRDKTKEGDVEIITVNNLLNEYPGCTPFLIKIDVEGFEDDLFAQNTEWVSEFYVLVIEAHDWLFPTMAKSKNSSFR